MTSFLLVLVPLTPLAAAALILMLSGRPRWGGWINAAGSAAALAALLALYGRQAAVHLEWARIGGYALTAGLRLDGLALAVALMVAGVSLLVHLYAAAFMAGADGQARFSAAMAAFTGAMLALVLADSFIVLFAAWEAVGVASFVLIAFRYQDPAAAAAGRKAFLMTRLGDMGLLLGWLWALQLSASTDIAGFLRQAASGGDAAPLLLPALFFLAAALGKSAQLPLSAWLPGAMIGPAPVSALIHSATMVAAGIYLLLRLYPLYALIPAALQLMVWIGAAGALAAALIATAQMDIKRILAWSTISQLGEMMLAVGLGGPAAAAAHLLTHGAFKSALFLAAGMIDRAAGTRDLSKMGGLLRAMPLTAALFGAGALSLAGVPPLGGFWSGDQILARGVAVHPFLGFWLITVIFLSGVYISRAAAGAFARWPGAAHPAPDEGRPGTLIPAGLLALGALAGGWWAGELLGHVASFDVLKPPAGWKIAAAAAGAAGLILGALRVAAAGPQPALGRFPLQGERLIAGLARAPAQAAAVLAAGIGRVETRFMDRGVRRLGSAAAVLEAGIGRLESGFLDRGARRLGSAASSLAGRLHGLEEHGLDGAARTAGVGTLRAADRSRRAEEEGFAAAGDGLAQLFGRTGGRLRTLQSGKLYLYTLGLFIWVLVTGVVSLAGMFK